MDGLRKTIKEEISQARAQATFGPSLIPFHQHLGTDGSPRLQQVIHLYHTLYGTAPATAANYSVFYTAPVPVIVVLATEVHTTAGSDVSAVTLNIEKLTGTTAPGSGTDMLSAGFDLKGTANTVQTATLTTAASAKQLQKGDRISLHLTGTPTSVANLQVTLLLNTI